MSVSANPAGSALPAQAADPGGQRGRWNLPIPPSDAEKTMYADRNLALIIRTSIASFAALLISQYRFIRLSPPLLALTPLIAFTTVYYVISLVVNIGTRGFDLKAHQRLVRGRPENGPTSPQI